jgi:hypothetical protein
MRLLKDSLISSRVVISALNKFSLGTPHNIYNKKIKVSKSP